MPPQVLKTSSLQFHRRHGHKNTPQLRNLITSATDSLSSQTNFSYFYNTTVYSIVVKYEAESMTSGTGNSISGTAIDSETK